MKPAKLRTYSVRWEIDVEEESPERAALAVLKIMRNPNSIALYFEVVDARAMRKVAEVDLELYAVCDNCRHLFRVKRDNDFATITDLNKRLEPGGMVPSCECPKCGALAYPATKMTYMEDEKE